MDLVSYPARAEGLGKYEYVGLEKLENPCVSNCENSTLPTIYPWENR